ncbi:MAG: phage holin family protein [Paracoccaceae bacterium]
MARPGLESLLVPLIDMLALGRRAVALRLALAQAELRVRASSVVTALVLGLTALLLIIIGIVLLVQAGLIGLAALGLTPLQSVLVAAAACAATATILILIARSCLLRATRPLTSITGLGDDLPANRP